MSFYMEEIFRNFSPEIINWVSPTANKYMDSSYGLRTTLHYELEYIISGSGFILINGTPFPIIPNSINFRHPGMQVEGIGIYHCLLIQFECNATHIPVNFFKNLQYNYPLHSDSIYSLKFQMLFHALETKHADCIFLIKITILELFQYMIQQSFPDANQTISLSFKNPDKIQKAIQYIQIHYAEPITVKELASLSGYSVFYFTRIFKEITSCTPIEFLIHYRLQQAKIMLQSSNHPVESVGRLCGFTNLSHFYRMFQTAYHCTPKQFRNKSGLLN